MAAGLNVAQTRILSLLMFTGGSQFAFVGVIGGGGAASAATAAASLVGLRNAVYGVQMNALLRPGWPRKLLQAVALWLRAPFLLVVVVGAVAAALVRLVG